MDLKKQKLLRKERDNIGEAEDRISELPDSLLHYILSCIDDIKCVFCTSLLSKRWNRVWTSIPTLVFPYFYKPLSLSDINNFMSFVDRTLDLHDTSYIQKFILHTDEHMNASRVYSWIENLTRRNMEELVLYLCLKKPFSVPSLFGCESLVKLDLRSSRTVHNLPKSLSFPKLKSLRLGKFRFTTDCRNGQPFSDFPVLEDLVLEDCTWCDVRNFCISTPTLKHLKFLAWDDDCLRNRALKIDAPNLVSLTYYGNVAKDYVLSSFETLESAKVWLRRSEQEAGAAVSKLFQALARVQTLSVAFSKILLGLLDEGNCINILPTFHNLKELILEDEITATDESLFALLKAAPNLTRLEFENQFSEIHHSEEEEEDSWAGHMLTAGCLFQHLRSVCFLYFCGRAREMRWLKLILKNADALHTVTIETYNEFIDAQTLEILKSELRSLPKASHRCLFEFRDL